MGRGCVGWVREVEEEEAGGGWGKEGGDVGGGELVDAFEIPTALVRIRMIFETCPTSRFDLRERGHGRVVGGTHI